MAEITKEVMEPQVADVYVPLDTAWHERFRGMVTRVGSIITAAAMVLATACACSEVEASSPVIERCYDSPQPDPVRPLEDATPPAMGEVIIEPGDSQEAIDAKAEAAYEEWEREYAAWRERHGPVRAHIDVNGFVEGDPVELDAGVRERVAGGLVTVSAKGGDNSVSRGTGWFVRGEDGVAYVVTAGHVVADRSVAGMTITTEDNRSFPVTDACYIMEDNGSFYQLDEHHLAPDTDVAILVVDGGLPSGVSPLKLSDTAPTIGKWVIAVNHQLDNGPGNPAEYPLLIGGVPPYQPYVAGAGLRDVPYSLTPAQFDATRCAPGASGGPVVDTTTGEVTGVTVGSADVYLDSVLLEAKANIVIVDAVGSKLDPGQFGPEQGLAPTSVIMTTVASVSTALASPRLRDGMVTVGSAG